MEAEVIPWFQMIAKNNPFQSWIDFTRALELEFRPSPYECLVLLLLSLCNQDRFRIIIENLQLWPIVFKALLQMLYLIIFLATSRFTFEGMLLLKIQPPYYVLFHWPSFLKRNICLKRKLP